MRRVIFEDIILKTKNLSKTYKRDGKTVHALDRVSLDIYRGEILTLLGVNGAGKTTLSSILATLHPPTDGTVLFQNHSITNALLSYRKALGFCPQTINLDEELNVRDNLLFAGRYFLMAETDVIKRTDELITLFNLEKYATSEIHELSGGYKRRLLIARALMHRPQILILDEPTVGLDPHIRRNLWDIIKQLKGEGITIILTTHYLDEAEVLSDRVCMLSEGKLVFVGTPHQLKEKHKKESLEEVFIAFNEEQEL